MKAGEVKQVCLLYRPKRWGLGEDGEPLKSKGLITVKGFVEAEEEDSTDQTPVLSEQPSYLVRVKL